MNERSEQPDSETDALAAARRRRTELKTAVSAVEVVASSATGNPSWRPRLGAALEDLKAAFEHHVVEVESDGGLLGELRGQAPRLANAIARLEDEHPELSARIDQTIAELEGGAPIDDVRSQVLDTLVAISRHRQRGADLVYEAYNVDIGGG